MNIIQARLRELRVKNDMSQREISAKLGIKQPAWARLESGAVDNPKASTIILICKTFNVSADWLLGLKE